MASERARVRWWAVIAGVVVAAVVAGLALLGGGDRPAVRAAATQRTAVAAPSTAPGRAAPGAASASESSSAPADSTSAAPTAGWATTAPPATGVTATPSPPVLAGRAPTGDGRPRVTFIGDSWAVGVGATDHRGYAVLTGEQLGWTYDVLGVSGSGYTQGGGQRITFGQRVDAAVATDADVIVVQGSLNERNSTPEALAAAARTTLQQLRREADPRTDILVVGSTYAPGTPDSTIDWINDAIAGAAAQVGLPFVDPTAEHWIDATDPGLWADANHPDDAGYQLVADHLARELRATVAR